MYYTIRELSTKLEKKDENSDPIDREIDLGTTKERMLVIEQCENTKARFYVSQTDNSNGTCRLKM